MNLEPEHTTKELQANLERLVLPLSDSTLTQIGRRIYLDTDYSLKYHDSTKNREAVIDLTRVPEPQATVILNGMAAAILEQLAKNPQAEILPVVALEIYLAGGALNIRHLELIFKNWADSSIHSAPEPMASFATLRAYEKLSDPKDSTKFNAAVSIILTGGSGEQHQYCRTFKIQSKLEHSDRLAALREFSIVEKLIAIEFKLAEFYQQEIYRSIEAKNQSTLLEAQSMLIKHIEKIFELVGYPQGRAAGGFLTEQMIKDLVKIKLLNLSKDTLEKLLRIYASSLLEAPIKDQADKLFKKGLKALETLYKDPTVIFNHIFSTNFIPITLTPSELNSRLYSLFQLVDMAFPRGENLSINQKNSALTQDLLEAFICSGIKDPATRNELFELYTKIEQDPSARLIKLSQQELPIHQLVNLVYFWLEHGSDDLERQSAAPKILKLFIDKCSIILEQDQSLDSEPQSAIKIYKIIKILEPYGQHLNPEQTKAKNQLLTKCLELSLAQGEYRAIRADLLKLPHYKDLTLDRYWEALITTGELEKANLYIALHYLECDKKLDFKRLSKALAKLDISKVNSSTKHERLQMILELIPHFRLDSSTPTSNEEILEQLSQLIAQVSTKKNNRDKFINKLFIALSENEMPEIAAQLIFNEIKREGTNLELLDSVKHLNSLNPRVKNSCAVIILYEKVIDWIEKTPFQYEQPLSNQLVSAARNLLYNIYNGYIDALSSYIGPNDSYLKPLLSMAVFSRAICKLWQKDLKTAQGFIESAIGIWHNAAANYSSSFNQQFFAKYASDKKARPAHEGEDWLAYLQKEEAEFRVTLKEHCLAAMQQDTENYLHSLNTSYIPEAPLNNSEFYLGYSVLSKILDIESKISPAEAFTRNRDPLKTALSLRLKYALSKNDYREALMLYAHLGGIDHKQIYQLFKMALKSCDLPAANRLYQGYTTIDPALELRLHNNYFTLPHVTSDISEIYIPNSEFHNAAREMTKEQIYPERLMILEELLERTDLEEQGQNIQFNPELHKTAIRCLVIEIAQAQSEKIQHLLNYYEKYSDLNSRLFIRELLNNHFSRELPPYLDAESAARIAYMMEIPYDDPRLINYVRARKTDQRYDPKKEDFSLLFNYLDWDFSPDNTNEYRFKGSYIWNDLIEALLSPGNQELTIDQLVAIESNKTTILYNLLLALDRQRKGLFSLPDNKKLATFKAISCAATFQEEIIRDLHKFPNISLIVRAQPAAALNNIDLYLNNPDYSIGANGAWKVIYEISKACGPVVAGANNSQPSFERVLDENWLTNLSQQMADLLIETSN